MNKDIGQMPRVNRVNNVVVSETGFTFTILSCWKLCEVADKDGKKIRFKFDIVDAFEGTPNEIACGLVPIFPGHRWYDGTLATAEELENLRQFLAAAILKEGLFPDVYYGTVEDVKKYRWNIDSVCAPAKGGFNVIQ